MWFPYVHGNYGVREEIFHLSGLGHQQVNYEPQLCDLDLFMQWPGVTDDIFKDNIVW